MFYSFKRDSKRTNTQKRLLVGPAPGICSLIGDSRRRHIPCFTWNGGETNDEREKSTRSDRKKKATLSMEELCWEKCEQLMRMLLLFVPVLNILDKEGCSLNFFVWPYCVFGCICWWPGVLDGHRLENFSLQRLFSCFIIGEVLTLLGKDSWGLVSLILPIITVTVFLSKHSFNTNDILYRIHFFQKYLNCFLNAVEILILI